MALDRRGVALLLPVLAAALAFAVAHPATARAEVVWLCKPGEEPNPCRESLETTIYSETEPTRVDNPPLHPDPPIDCFYVYPTVSGQPGTNANKDKDDELYAIARYQAGRFSQQCRVFAPVYRQLTLASIFMGTPEQRAAGGKLAYGDVLEAWREYLARYNGGRGFVLIGHSQGVRMLRQLIREEVDPKADVRRHLVSALLLGGNVLVRKGQRAGGDFQSIPACAAADETRCVIAYSAFNEPPPENARFGRAPTSDTSGVGFPAGPDYEVLCSNPASLGANERRPLTTYLRSEPFPGSIGAALVVMFGGPPPSAPTPWLQPSDRYAGRCEQSRGANVLMIEGLGNARRLNPSPDPSWGLHLADVNIALGELVDEVGQAGASYLEGRRPRSRILSRRLRVTRGGRLRVLVACRGDRDVVCAGRLRLRSAAAQLGAVRRRVSFGSRPYLVRGGSRRRVGVRVPRRALALLRRRGTMRVRAELLAGGSDKRLDQAMLRVRPPLRRR